MPFAGASAVPIDFEAFTDSTPLTTEVAGLTFSGGFVYTAGVSLNEFDYPPVSGSNVLAALNGTLDIFLDAPATGFSGYFTYGQALTFNGYDALNQLLFSFNTADDDNLGATTLVSRAAAGLHHLNILGANGGAFVLDDLDIVNGVQQLPEPGSLALLALGALTAGAVRRRRA